MTHLQQYVSCYCVLQGRVFIENVGCACVPVPSVCSKRSFILPFFNGKFTTVTYVFIQAVGINTFFSFANKLNFLSNS
jgi:hypothetical protein